MRRGLLWGIFSNIADEDVQWFHKHGFQEEHFDAPDHAVSSVGAHRCEAEPGPLEPEQHLFRFIK
jgi:hypothetical protein